MNIHEFQAKQLFAQFGIPVPIGKEIKTPLAAEKWAAKLNAPVYVVKAQRVEPVGLVYLWPVTG